MSSKALIWFRQDLRISDNPALDHAIKNSDEVAAIYILDEKSKNVRAMGSASKWWLHHALTDLQKNLKEKYEIDLIIAEGKSDEVLDDLNKKYNFDLIVWNRLYEPFHTARDKKIKEFLSKTTEVKSFNGSVLVEPWDIKNSSGSYFKVFTAFYRNAIAKHKPRDVLKAPEKQNKNFGIKTKSLKISDLNLLPTKPNWAKNFKWDISEKGAHDALYEFLDVIKDYSDNRNIPGVQGTSKLSPYLHFGQISPHQILNVCHFHENTKSKLGIDKFITELYWRDFNYHLLYHFPIDKENFNNAFDNFKWSYNKNHLEKWQKGKTGYPLVDAGMRELWATGWMHNRVRMVVASFLCKHLLIDWKKGEEWFWDTLLDADLANNCGNWQWVAGSGADAAPYFRIFNPVTQSERFDAKGEYIKKWCPELKDLPEKYIHVPWEAPEEILEKAKIKIGKDYPEPMVDHKQARDKALAAYKQARNS